MELNKAFGRALKTLRKHRGLTQEAFSGVSSRTYLSSLERGLKGPTIEKLEQLAGVLDVHPTTLLMTAYLCKDDFTEKHAQALNSRILSELESFREKYN